MKKILISMLLVSAVAVSMVGCGNKTEGKDNNTNVEQNEQVNGSEESNESGDLNVKGIMDGILALNSIPMPMEINEEDAEAIYHLDLKNVEEFAISVCGRSPGVGLVVLVEAKEGQVDSVKQSVEAVLADNVANAFYPMEQEAYENAKVEVNGNLVSLIVVDSSVQEEVTNYFNSQIGQ